MTNALGAAKRLEVADQILGAGGRNISCVADAMAEILINEGTDLSDEASVERTIRRFHPFDRHDEVEVLVEACPDIARGIAARRMANDFS